MNRFFFKWMLIIEKYFHFKQFGRYLSVNFIHCYRPRELPKRYAPKKILKVKKNKKKQIHLLVPVFTISLNIFKYPFVLYIFVLYVARSIHVVLVPALACDSLDKWWNCRYRATIVHSTNEMYYTSSRTRIRLLIVRSSYGMLAHDGHHSH